MINAEKPDLVGLNEVDQGHESHARIDMPAELARLTGMTAVFEKNIDYDGGKYGNAVLSRLPIRRHENHKLPSHYEGEQRGVLEVEVGDEGEPLLLPLHASRLSPRRRRAAWRRSRRLKKIVARQRRPRDLVGDLNASPESKVMETFAKGWGRANPSRSRRSPPRKPEKQIDYILVRPAGAWEVVETRVLDEAVASDHRGPYGGAAAEE